MATQIDATGDYNLPQVPPTHQNMDPIDQDDSWKVIDAYFKQNGLVAQ
jgi:hypothetical protein